MFALHFVPSMSCMHAEADIARERVDREKKSLGGEKGGVEFINAWVEWYGGRKETRKKL